MHRNIVAGGMGWILSVMAKFLPACLAGGFAILASVPIEQASSNLAGWWAATGLPPIDHLVTPRTDAIILGASLMLLAVVLFWPIFKWFTYASLREEIAELKEYAKKEKASTKSNEGSVTILGGIHIGSMHIGSDGKHRADIEGKGEIVSPVPIVHEERIGISDSWEAELHRSDGTIERYSSDQGT